MKWIKLLVAVSLLLPMTACGGFLDWLYEPGYARLPENYQVFEVYEKELPGEEPQWAFDYNGRTYVRYSDISEWGSMDVKECLGCLSLPEELASVSGVQEDMRVLSLSCNDSDDYLVVQFVPTLMAPPTEVYCALDTRGRDIETPKFILPPDPEDETEEDLYRFWTEQPDAAAKGKGQG